MSTYTIQWIEKLPPTKNGKGRSKASLLGENGESFDDVKIWDDFPGYASLSSGGSVQGYISEHPQYGASLRPLQRRDSPQRAARPTAIAQAQTRREVGIAAAQEAKSEGVKLGMAFRDATTIVVELYGIELRAIPPHERDTAWQEKHRTVRKYLMEEFDKEKTRLDYPNN